MQKKLLFLFMGICFTLIFTNCSTDEDNVNEREGYTYIPDDQLEQWLIDLGHDDVLDDYILTENAQKVLRLCADEYSIDDFTGLEAFLSLETLCVYWGKFTSIDLSKNINLKSLTLQGENALTSIDLKSNTKLLSLNLWGNALTNIDLSNNTQLVNLDLSGNNLNEIKINSLRELTGLSLYDNNLKIIDIADNLLLESLIIRNNLIETIEVNHLERLKRLDIEDNKIQSVDVSQNINLTSFNATNNLLECIQVNQTQLNNTSNNTSINDWYWSKDDSAQYSLNCENENGSSSGNRTYIPDDNLEGWLISQGYDDLMDDYVTTEAVRNIQNVIIDNCEIADLTGIEDFHNLEILKICSNNLKKADFSNNIKLYTLHISAPLESINLNNNLELNELYLNYGVFSAINLENNTQLVNLNLDQNEIKNIDLSKQIYLKELSIFQNKLTALDLSNNSQLTTVFATENLLTEINVQNLKNLVNLNIYMNKLTKIDLKDNVKLQSLNSNDNELSGLDVSKTSLSTLRIYSNPLNCINVNQTQLSSLTLYAEEGVKLSLDCG